ncbi:MAG: hypothetical protein IJT20_05710 [Synergistaceae bacterium]|nr:hypothetical protein [Synergistaceae bacterium]
MRKILLTFPLIFIFSCSAYAAPVVEDNAELHRIVGGLYALVSAVELNANSKPDINSLVRFFERVPPGWQDEVEIKNDKDKKIIWVGISAGTDSEARSYLRLKSKELGIFDKPGGDAWLGGKFAWIKAADTSKKKIKPVNFSAAQGDNTIFFNAPGTDTWWAAWPAFTSRAKRDILEARGVDDAVELHAPAASERNKNSSAMTSIYDEVKPSSVRVPDEMHMSRKKSSFDMSVEVGDVIFNPIPNVRR